MFNKINKHSIKVHLVQKTQALPVEEKAMGQKTAILQLPELDLSDFTEEKLEVLVSLGLSCREGE